VRAGEFPLKTAADSQCPRSQVLTEIVLDIGVKDEGALWWVVNH
jgi:hypothetical protein